MAKFFYWASLIVLWTLAAFSAAIILRAPRET